MTSTSTEGDVAACETGDGRVLVVRDPENGAVVGRVPAATPEDARRALDRAEAALERFRATSAHARAEVLERAATALELGAERFADLIASEGIKTVREARGEVRRAVFTLRTCAHEAVRTVGREVRFDAHPDGADRTGYALPEPVGIVLGITPFNDPLNLVVHKVGPALAAGCPIIVKPHEQTPLTALALVELLEAAGATGGRVQVLPGSGPALVPVLLGDERVRSCSFTGGLDAGRAVAAATGICRLTMELGACNASIVLDDACLESATTRLVAGAFAAAGQNCLHVQRVIVQGGVHDALRDRLAVAARAVRVGPKRDPRTDMGCLVSEASARRVQGLVDSAIAGGARALVGGTRTGTLFAPTLLEDVPADHPLLHDEVFGPVTCLVRTQGLETAIATANDTPFGLHASIFTRSLESVRRAVDGLRAGAVLVNDSTDYRLDAMPFGGTKRSGIGREGVRPAIDAMTEPKLVCSLH